MRPVKITSLKSLGVLLLTGALLQGRLVAAGSEAGSPPETDRNSTRLKLKRNGSANPHVFTAGQSVVAIDWTFAVEPEASDGSSQPVPRRRASESKTTDCNADLRRPSHTYTAGQGTVTVD